MGGALLSRWQHSSSDIISHIHVIDPHSNAHLTANTSSVASLDVLPASAQPDVIIFAVKPQKLAEILPAYKMRFGVKPLYISIAAGKTLEFFAQQLGDHAHVVRAMPNTPAMIGKGVTGLCARNTLSESAKQIATKLMQAVGTVQWLADEEQMHALTAISGSGPAYVFAFLDTLTNAGIHAGLPENMARSLALETVIGSAALAGVSHETFEQLRKNVTSPGGTTEAAIDVLLGENGLARLVDNSVKAAQKRSRELASTN